MIADIFRILGALYWVPAYQRGYYARNGTGYSAPPIVMGSGRR